MFMSPRLHTFLVHFFFIGFKMQMHNNSYDFHAKLFSTYGDFELKANCFLRFWEV